MSARAVLASIAALSVAHALSFRESGPFDDDYIVYRYAHNWVSGHGLVFNPGERFEGFTVPLWVFVIAAGLKLGIAAPVTSFVVSLCAGAATTLAVGDTWRRLRPGSVLPWPALFVALSPAIAWHGAVGLGTVPLAALLSLWTWAYARALEEGRSMWPATVFLALAMSLRAEVVLFAVPFVWLEFRRTRGATPAWLVFAPLAAWTVFRWFYYGRLTPIPYDLKKLSLVADLTYGVRYFAAASATTGFMWFVALALVRRTPRPAERALQAATIGLLLHLCYVIYVGGDFMPLARFFVPVLPLAALVGGLGACSLLARAPNLLAGLGFLVLLASQWPQFVTRPEVAARHAEEEVRWEALGRDFKERVVPGTSVALSPIGAFGYYSELPIVDLLGLTNDAVLRAAPDLEITMKGHHRYDAEWALAQEPAIIILGNGRLDYGPDPGPVGPPPRPRLVVNEWERTLFQNPKFQRDYKPMKVEIRGSYPLIFYLRRDVPPPVGSTPA